VPSSALERAYRDLGRTEPVFARLIKEYGRPEPFTWHDGGRTGTSQFAAMLLHIAGQQISTNVAFAIYDRLMTATGGIPTPAAILALDHDALRACGLSEAKVGYVQALATAQNSGAIDIEHLDGRSDAEVLAALTAIRGIGVWSAEMFLIVNLRRTDVLPAGDLGIRRAVQDRWNLAELPAPKAVRIRAQVWTPWRSYAATLLWRSLVPPTEPAERTEPADDRRRSPTGTAPAERPTISSADNGVNRGSDHHDRNFGSSTG
jgi:3-methyladenine DNA glycosylase/8-oxoguanine DNA glycosylase